jgi:hypothetical protein
MDGYPEEKIDKIIETETVADPESVTVVYGKQRRLEGDKPLTHTEDAKDVVRFQNARRVLDENRTNILGIIQDKLDLIREHFKENLRKYPELQKDYEEFRKSHPDIPSAQQIIDGTTQIDPEAFALFFDYRRNNAYVVVLNKRDFLDFQDVDNHWDLHTGTRRNAVYIPGGIFQGIANIPHAYAAALADEVLDGILGRHTVISSRLTELLAPFDELDKKIQTLASNNYISVLDASLKSGDANLRERMDALTALPGLYLDPRTPDAYRNEAFWLHVSLLKDTNTDIQKFAQKLFANVLNIDDKKNAEWIGWLVSLPFMPHDSYDATTFSSARPILLKIIKKTFRKRVGSPPALVHAARRMMDEAYKSQSILGLLSFNEANMSRVKDLLIAIASMKYRDHQDFVVARQELSWWQKVDRKVTEGIKPLQLLDQSLLALIGRKPEPMARLLEWKERTRREYDVNTLQKLDLRNK